MVAIAKVSNMSTCSACRAVQRVAAVQRMSRSVKHTRRLVAVFGLCWCVAWAWCVGFAVVGLVLVCIFAAVGRVVGVMFALVAVAYVGRVSFCAAPARAVVAVERGVSLVLCTV